MAFFSLSLRSTPLAGVLLAVALGAGACSNGPGDEQDLVSALTRDATFTEAQAQCIAGSVFDKYGADDAALKKLSHVGNYDDLVGTNGIPDFDAFFTDTINACTGN
jgi:hypothetical protein